MGSGNAKLQSGANNSSRATIVSNSFIFIGVCIILAALVYMIVNLNRADSIITMWIPFIAAGVFLSFFGLIFSILTRNSERKMHNFKCKIAS